ncbi:hypothetical protein ES703_110242 [subsurface metagenome]
MRLKTYNGGETWEDFPNDDHIFAEFGTPPSPPPPPDPPIPNWTILDIVQTLTATGYKIVVTTNVPCHLYMRWTTIEPQEHIKPVERRGVFLPSDKYFCFDVYKDNQQEEAGDTTTHTFIKEPWPECETRYFYFHGTIAGEASPSTSPIFKKHRKPPPWGPPIEETFYPDPTPEVTSVDGWIRKQAHVPWATLITGDGTEVIDYQSGNPILIVSGSTPDLWWNLCRAYYLFDTSTLPGNCEILEAKLHIYITTKDDLLNILPDLNVFAADPLSNTQLVLADFSRVSSVPFSTAIPYNDIDTEAFAIFTLNEAGIAAISLTAITKFSVRNANYDAAAIAPSWTSFKTSFLGPTFAEAEEGKRPKLVITYRVPA